MDISDITQMFLELFRLVSCMAIAVITFNLLLNRTAGGIRIKTIFINEKRHLTSTAVASVIVYILVALPVAQYLADNVLLLLFICLSGFILDLILVEIRY